MNPFENISLLFISIGASLLCIIVAVLYQHFVSVKYAQNRLLQELAILPLAQLLLMLGIPLKTYTHKTRWEIIRSQIAACRNCKYHSQCKKCLENGKRIFDMNACPNYPSLAELSPRHVPERIINR